MDGTRLTKRLLVSTALLGALAAHPALAQNANANAAATERSTGIEEVVVTATRQTNTVNRVALSIAAVTQRTLDEQGIKQAQDISRLVPGLNLTPTEARGAASTAGNFSIRGVAASVGAATTGIYLDDVSLTKRANAGTAQVNGAPLPILFDLERVEVLKGPQGTLYGGSAQGGAIRFITPAPSLTRYSGQARVEVNSVTNGGLGHEIGLAVGGPLVTDKLGFRISGMERRTAGYVDAYNAYTHELLKKDGNGRTETMINPQLLWQITPDFSAKASWYWGRSKSDGGPLTGTSIYLPNGQLAPSGQTFTTPTTCNPVIAFRPNVPQRPIAQIGTCASLQAAGRITPGPGGLFERPGMTYGPWKTDKDINLVTTGQGRMAASVINDTRVGALTLQYRTKWFTAVSITSIINDETDLGETASGEDPNSWTVTTADPTHPGFPLFYFAKPNGIVGDYNGGFISKNKRQQVAQEVRLSSPADQRPLTWVAGLYYSDANVNIGYRYPGFGTPQLQAYYGINAETRYGITNLEGLMARLDAKMVDRELAAFVDANYWITDKLKLNAGVRYSDLYFNYDQLNYGQFSGRFPNNPLSITRGVAKSRPVAPKFGLEYQFAPDKIVYFTAAKGFRAGGVNPAVSRSTCENGLNQLGITEDQIPAAYGPDEVWSYEVGEKFRLLDNKLQLNTALFRIDWSNVQATIPISCGFNFVSNGAGARSEGFDLQSTFRPIQPLTLTLNTSYTDARYLQAIAGPNPGAVPNPVFNAGDGFGIPKWQVSSSAQWDQHLTGLYNGYVRLDYQWQDAYKTTSSYNTPSYNPFTYNAPARSFLNLRIGVRRENAEINVYANNIANNRSWVGNPGVGRTNCTPPTAANPNTGCTAYANYNPLVNTTYQQPRVVGVQVNYRF